MSTWIRTASLWSSLAALVLLASPAHASSFVLPGAPAGYEVSYDMYFRLVSTDAGATSSFGVLTDGSDRSSAQTIFENIANCDQTMWSCLHTSIGENGPADEGFRRAGTGNWAPGPVTLFISTLYWDWDIDLGQVSGPAHQRTTYSDDAVASMAAHRGTRDDALAMAAETWRRGNLSAAVTWWVETPGGPGPLRWRFQLELDDAWSWYYSASEFGAVSASDDNDLIIDGYLDAAYTPIPEPATAALLALGLSAYLASRRFRR